MWPRNAGGGPSKIVSSGLECCCMIWSAATVAQSAGIVEYTDCTSAEG